MEGRAVIARLTALRKELGTVGAGSLCVLSACLAFQLGTVRPLEAKARALDLQLAALPARTDGLKLVRSRSPIGAMSAFYRAFDTGERIDESLARLYGIAGATGLELRTADYRLGESKQRLERYEISLPVSGSYSQIRLFLATALAELPTISLDRAVLRRKNANDTRVDADLVLTLYRLRE